MWLRRDKTPPTHQAWNIELQQELCIGPLHHWALSSSYPSRRMWMNELKRYYGHYCQYGCPHHHQMLDLDHLSTCPDCIWWIFHHPLTWCQSLLIWEKTLWKWNCIQNRHLKEKRRCEKKRKKKPREWSGNFIDREMYLLAHPWKEAR